MASLRLLMCTTTVRPVLVPVPLGAVHPYHRLRTSPLASRSFTGSAALCDDTKAAPEKAASGPVSEEKEPKKEAAQSSSEYKKEERAKTSSDTNRDTKSKPADSSNVAGQSEDRPAPTSKPAATSKVHKSEGSSTTNSSLDDWETSSIFNVEKFADLPHDGFGYNQHMVIDAEFKKALGQILWQFRAPVRYAFAYGSGVFPQSKQDGHIASAEEIRRVHPRPPIGIQKAQTGAPKMIDFIFGVTFTQHWHSLNLKQHRDHYSALGSLGSGAVSYVQDRMGAGVYFNTHVAVDGTLIKYGVVNIDTLCRDLSEWDTLYLAGRLHKPVKILRDEPRVRLANQINLLSALRTALLLLPEKFTEMELYQTIAGISYLGDPRMTLPTENPQKVSNIVGNNFVHFSRLYNPLLEALPNVSFDTKSQALQLDRKIRQDMDPKRRGNMVRRLPKAFRSKLYFQYQRKFQIPQAEFEDMMSSDASRGSKKIVGSGGFEMRIANDDPAELRGHVRKIIKNTIGWPSTTQSLKGILTGGIKKSMGYVWEKAEKYRAGVAKVAADTKQDAKEVKADIKEFKKGATQLSEEAKSDATPKQGKKD